MQVFKIWIESEGQTISDAEAFASGLTRPVDIVEQYAEYFYSAYDGYAYDWPVTFTLASKDGAVLARVAVEMNTDPRFYGDIV